MTQTNLQIAQGLYKKKKYNDSYLAMAHQHLSDCKRFLEFLEPYIPNVDVGLSKLSNEISDLKSTIKFYEDNGIQE